MGPDPHLGALDVGYADCRRLAKERLRLPGQVWGHEGFWRSSPLLSWGGLQKHGVKNKFEFLTFFETRQKGRNVNGFLPQPLLLDQSNARTRRSKTCQKYARTRVHRCASSGKYAGSEGWIHTYAPMPTMPRKWVPGVTNPTPSNKGVQTAWPEKSEKFRENFFRTQKWFCLRSRQCFFFTKIFRTFFHCVARGFFDGFSRFFSHIFSHYFSHGDSRRIFRMSLLRIFLTHFFIAVCCPKGFHSLQSQHYVTVPETGHTTTCRSSPSLLTQYSHKQVEKIKSFWKDKRQNFTLQTIRHYHYFPRKLCFKRSLAIHLEVPDFPLPGVGARPIGLSVASRNPKRCRRRTFVRNELDVKPP